jgi:branched-chain amino acid transport system permease protein
MRNRTDVGVLGVCVVLVLAPFFLSTFDLDVLTTGVIYGLMAMGLALLVGQAGLPSLGHAAFVGVGGYAAALLSQHVTSSPLLGLLVAAAVGAVLALLLGLMSLRSQGVYFLMISLALAELLHAASVGSDLLGGDNGMTIDSVAAPVLGRLGLPPTVAFYWYALAIAVLGYGALRLLAAAPVGQSILGSKDNPDRMRAIGYSVRALRMTALVVSGVTVAVGGALLTQKDVFISPTTLAPQVSILLLVMVLVGGSTSLLGPFLAGIGLVFLRSYTSSTVGEYWVLVLGVVFVLTVYLLPRGIAGMLRQPQRRERREAPKEVETVVQ